MSRARVEDIYPLTPLQAGFFFHHTMTPEDDPYVPQLCIDLGPEVDIAALERAVQELAARHAVLRTSVHVRKDGDPLQVVHASVEVPFERLDAPVPDDRFDAWLEDNRRRGFDLRRAPLTRMTLLPRTDGWRLVWATHHFVMDGWSHRLLLRELSELYRAALDGNEATLAPAPSFKAFIAWLKQRDPDAAIAFWKHALADFSEITPLGGRPRAATSTPRWTRREHLVDRALTGRIEAFARANRITLATLAFAAWALVMARYSGRREVVFGVTVSGRSAPIPNIETTTGPFINTVPLRIALPRIRVDEWLRRLQAQMHEASAHEHVPLTEIQQLVAGGRPIFDTLLVVENHLTSDGAARALPIRGLRFHDHSHYPLTVWVHPGAELSLRVEYDDERYAGTAIPNAMRHLECALANLVGQSTRTLDEIEIVPDDERDKLLVMWNETSVPVDTAKCIHEPFEAQVDRAPDAIALVSDEGQRTYGEIEHDANRLAHRLVALGVRPGMFVGVLLERSPEMIVTLLAIMKVGGAYLPLDPNYPKDRLEYLVADMRAEVVVTERRHRQNVSTARTIVLDDEADAAAIARCSEDRLKRRVTADCFAYVIYTSGSTGKPKGVLVTHRPVINLIDWVNRTYDVGPNDRLLFVASLSFDLSVYDIFGMLAAGGSIRIVKGADLKEPERLFRILASEPITFWDSAPAMLQSVSTAFPLESLPNHSLRLVFLSGDWIPVKLPDAIRKVFTRARVISLGGATEATVWSNHYPIGHVDPSWPSIPYGVPMQNARYHVLDQRLQPCPVGVTGDLYIAGDCLSTGYANAPELTAWKYIPDPFSDRPGARMYRTGDLARYFADGNLEFCGRADTQVKIRGYRIELGEIEGALQEHPAVRDAIVLAREDIPGEKRLVAYLVAKEPEGLTGATRLEIDDVREHARQRLPEYMIPAALVILDQLPLTANGKVDRKQLPLPEIAAAHAFTGPRTPVEEAIAEIWREVLGVAQVGIHDDFFELGGHSLLATQLASRIRRTLSVALSLRSLIEAPTIAGIAETLAAAYPDISLAVPAPNTPPKGG